jgi:hypothetical protein
MKFKFSNIVLAGFILSVSCLVNISNAGLITDTDNDSFIDETTGLEWMDFGINNRHTFDQVKGLLSTTYTGWTLATQTEVLTLWHNAFADDATAISISNSGARYADYRAFTTVGRLAYKETYVKMGDRKNSMRGWFEDYTGSLSYTHYNITGIPTLNTHVYGRGINYDAERTNSGSLNSTMLVRTSQVSVPEPSTLAIFALALMGLASLRKRESKL